MKKLLAVAALLFSLVLMSDTVPVRAQDSGGGVATGGARARVNGRGGRGPGGRFRRGGANLRGQGTAAQVAQATASNAAPVDATATTGDATTTTTFDSSTDTTDMSGTGTGGARSRSRRGGLPNTGGDPWLLGLSGLLVTAAALGLRKRYC
jgi:hypothetical protein